MIIKHPEKDFTGTLHLGPCLADFEDGVAEVSDTVVFEDGTIDHLTSAGFTVGENKPTQKAKAAAARLVEPDQAPAPGSSTAS